MAHGCSGAARINYVATVCSFHSRYDRHATYLNRKASLRPERGTKLRGRIAKRNPRFALYEVAGFIFGKPVLRSLRPCLRGSVPEHSGYQLGRRRIGERRGGLGAAAGWVPRLGRRMALTLPLLRRRRRTARRRRILVPTRPFRPAFRAVPAVRPFADRYAADRFGHPSRCRARARRRPR